MPYQNHRIIRGQQVSCYIFLHHQPFATEPAFVCLNSSETTAFFFSTQTSHLLYYPFLQPPECSKLNTNQQPPDSNSMHFSHLKKQKQTHPQTKRKKKATPQTKARH